jgi:dihydrofolate reductase
MAKVRVHNFTITLDGFATGPNQRMDAPFGDGMEGLHDWMFAAMEDGATGLDSDFLKRWDQNTGATIMGRNMFSPHRGPWQDESWTGWWGPNPPYHHDTFVRTHHLRPSIPMEGGTTFHFTDEPAEKVLERAFEAADGQDVVIAGGPTTVQEYLRAGLIDELHVVIAPILAGAGVRLFDNLEDALTKYRVSEQVSSSTVTHIQLTRR